MEPAVFEELERTLSAEGPAAALDRLCARLREAKDYDGLFHARLLARRHELGLPLVPSSPASDLTDESKPAFEKAIAAACREAGENHLRAGNFTSAYSYYKALDETEPVRDALLAHKPAEDDSVDQLVQLALYEGLAPRKGFDWVIERFGLCSSITNLSNTQLPMTPEDRRYCIGRVLRTLYAELCERVASDIETREGKRPEVPHGKAGTLRALLAGRDTIFGEDAYHVDLSHLSSAVQMSLDLEPGEDLELARELCEYGQRLSSSYKTESDPPFDEPYKDQAVYLAILAGETVEQGIAHFQKKVEAAVEEQDPRPAEVLVQLLLRLNRPAEALAVAARHLTPMDNPWLAFTADLCRRANDYAPLAEGARKQGNPVQFVAGLLACRK